MSTSTLVSVDQQRILFASVRRTLAVVTELKNLMDNVFSSIASGVLTTDLEERLVMCNRSARLIQSSPRASADRLWLMRF